MDTYKNIGDSQNNFAKKKELNIKDDSIVWFPL